MSTTPMNPRSTVIPCLRYRDAPKAIEWLCSVFGFEKHLVVMDADAVYQRAKAAGARSFSCRDPEGLLWSVGSYDPW